MIELIHLSKAYPGRHGMIQALSDVSLSILRNEFISIIGPSGCGKSTLLKLVGDILQPTHGEIKVNGISANEARARGMFSYVFQNPALLPWRRVIENVRLPLEILPRGSRDPSDLLKMVGLEGSELLYPNQLSGGMQQRVALARALTYDPAVLLMDEPFGAADELTRQVLNAELVRLWREIGVTILFVTHSIAEALFLATRVVVLTPRPARLAHVLDVPFERPRHESLKESQLFQTLVKDLRGRLE